MFFLSAAVVCPFPLVVGNATTNKHAHTYDSVVVYTCPRGYMMPGNKPFEQIRCQADKQWSEIPQNCTSKGFLVFWFAAC